MTKEKAKSLAFRFLRGGISGAVASMATILGAGTYSNGISSLADLELWYVSLVFAGLVGFTSGVILTADKYFRLQ